jgi:hypothetical protein
MNNYGMSEGVCCRTGETVYYKSSCQGLRIFPAPPGFWEIHVDVFSCEEDPEKRREDYVRGARALAQGDGFVPCQHPDCWVCLGQKELPTHGKIYGRPYGLSVRLSGEENLFKRRPSHLVSFMRFVVRVRNWWLGR